MEIITDGIQNFVETIMVFEVWLNGLVEKQVRHNLTEAGIETRPAKSNGLLCCGLIPSILMLYCWLCQVSPSYRLTAYVSLSMLMYSILFVLFMSLSSTVLHEVEGSGCLACGLISATLIYTNLNCSLLTSLFFTIVPVLCQSMLLRYLITTYPKTFTIGEVNVVVQGVVLFWVGAVSHLILDQHKVHTNDVIVYTVLVAVSLLVWILTRAAPLYDSVESLVVITTIAGGLTLLVLHTICGPLFLFNFIRYIFWDPERFHIFSIWFAMLVLAVCLIVIRTNMGWKADTVVRKVFHILAAVVFITGILYDKEFLRLAAGCVLAVIIYVEALRKLNIDPISTKLQEAFEVYSDHKDCGAFAVTPIYLYAGLSCPLVLVPDDSRELELMAGVLAIGIGDTAASWLGSRYGYTKWLNNEKTMEGTFFNIISQVSTVYFLTTFDLIANTSLVRASVAALVTSAVEAQTVQVDNLILPLVFILTSQLCWFL